jgi:hypothetical protein
MIMSRLLSLLIIGTTLLPTGSHAQQANPEDPAVEVCERSRFDGRTAAEIGFSRQAWSMTGATVAIMFASNDGRAVEVDCPFRLNGGKIVFADTTAPHIARCIEYLRFQRQDVSDAEFCKTLTNLEPFYQRDFAENVIAPLMDAGIYPIDPAKTALDFGQ